MYACQRLRHGRRPADVAARLVRLRRNGPPHRFVFDLVEPDFRKAECNHEHVALLETVAHLLTAFFGGLEKPLVLGEPEFGLRCEFVESPPKLLDNHEDVLKGYRKCQQQVFFRMGMPLNGKQPTIVSVAYQESAEVFRETAAKCQNLRVRTDYLL